jgi:hypothetical protein
MAFIVEITIIFNYTKNSGKRFAPPPERLRRGKQGSRLKPT